MSLMRDQTIFSEEELKWYQRAKVKNMLEGDANTKYFHLVANWKHRKNSYFPSGTRGSYSVW